jgi:hypothetical protein
MQRTPCGISDLHVCPGPRTLKALEGLAERLARQAGANAEPEP